MAYENSQAFTIENKKMVGSQQFENTCRLEISSDKQIKNVVCVKALPKIDSKEKVGDSLNFSGRTAFSVVYQTVDGLLETAFAEVEWTENLQNLPYENVFLYAKEQETIVTGFSLSEINVASSILVEISACVSDKISSIANLPEEYEKSEKTYEYNKVICSLSESFNEVKEEEVSSSVKEVIFSDGFVNVKNVELGLDTIAIDGDIIVGLALKNDNGIENISRVLPFRQEFNAGQVVPNNFADVCADLISLKATASVNETEQKTILIISTEVKVDAAIYSKETLSVIEDAFSVNKETVISSECVLKETFEKEGMFVDNIVGSFTKEFPLYELCFVKSSKAFITNKTQKQEGISLSGAIQVELVAKNEEEDYVLIKGVVPFELNVPDAQENDQIIIDTKITSFKNRAQNEIEIMAELIVKYKTYMEEYIPFINSIEETDERENNIDAIRVYIVKSGETLFDVAKALCVKVEDILLQNSFDEEDLHEGSRVVVYSSLKAEF